MAKDKMSAISISPGQKIQAEHFRLADGGVEANVQDEFDYRREALHTPQVVNKPISSDSDWGLSGWTPGDSFEISVPAGDLYLKKGVADIGGRRYIRTGDGSIESEAGVRAGVTANGFYYVRIKYVVSTDTHSYIAEATQSSETNDDKYITLAYAEVDNYPTTPYNWTTLTDLRSSNTSLQPPVNFSGDTDGPAVAVLTVEQTGSTETALEVLGGDVVLFTSGSPFKHVIYGNDTVAVRIYSGATNYGDLRASSSTANYLETPGSFGVGTNLTVTGQSTLGTVVVNGAVITAATSIGSLGTITLANTGASMTLVNAADQVIALTNSGAGNLNMTIDGKLTVSATGSNIAGSATIGGVVMNANNVTADALNLKDATNQIVLDSDSTTGTMTMAALGSARVWTFPNATGTVAVSGTAPIAVNSTTGEITHSTASPYKHVPTAGATTQILQWSAAGTAKWVTPSGDASIADGGVITVDGTAHAHTGAQISALDMDSDPTAGTLAVARGGTNLGSYTTGDLLYASASTAISKLGLQGASYCLVGGATAPAWTNTPNLDRLQLTPGAQAATSILDIAPTGAFSSGSSGYGIRIDGANIDPSVASMSVYGIDVQFTNLSTANNPFIYGVRAILPATYTTSTTRAGYFAGDGRTVEICNTTYAIDTIQDCRIASSGTLTVNDIDPMSGATCGFGNGASEYFDEGWFYTMYYNSLGSWDIYDDIKMLRGMKPSGTTDEKGIPEFDPTTIPKIVKTPKSTDEDAWVDAASYQGLIRGAVVQLAEKTLAERFVVTLPAWNTIKQINVTKCFDWMEADKDEVFVQATPSKPVIFGADIKFEDDEVFVVIEMQNGYSKDLKFSIQIGCNIKTDRVCYEVGEAEEIPAFGE